MNSERAYVRRRAHEFAKTLRAERSRLRRHPRARGAKANLFDKWGHGRWYAPGGPAPMTDGAPARILTIGSLFRWQKPLRVSAVVVLGCLSVAWATIGLSSLLARGILASAPAPPPSQTFWSADGQLVGASGNVVGEPVHLQELPPYVVQALLAIEDRRFLPRLLPIDIRGTARAIAADSKCRCFAQGGSTLAQQLAKLRLRDSSPRLSRKVREALVATYLQQQLGKQGVIEAYLNGVYFGHGFVGLRAASEGYFGKGPQDLSLSEAAELAGLLKAPSVLNPFADSQASWSRARVVLDRMAEESYITSAQAFAARQPDVVSNQTTDDRGYLLDALHRELVASGRQAPEGAYATTINAHLQEVAERAVASSAAAAVALGAHEVAVVVMRPDGSVVAMVGGRDHATSQFNRALDAKRPIGSLAKLLVYGAALDAGVGPNDMVDDAPVRIGQWSPRNVDGRFMGRMPVREALADSRNAAAVRLAQQVGLDRVIRFAHASGVNAKLDTGHPSFLLGTFAMSPVEVAAMIATLTHCGPVRPHMMVTNGPAGPACNPILSRKAQEGLISSMRATLDHGTGRAGRFPGSASCEAKTGTTNDARDSWFAGECDGLIAIVWLGNDDDSPTRTSGGGLPARIWREVMSAATNIATETP